jgi:hypothetical protein
MEEQYLQADGFESALIGFVYPWPHRQKTAVYDREKCIEILMERDGMGRGDAEEFFDYNTDGAYVGEQTPLFLSKPE